eukprot:CAMPEP_0184663034 /NCGR_PEP_ID=MMETSP0308-20130426/46205_1 /TAXON_ID=38269 /ORGANISM="Gloeochaete witrockiana, Strain SAG 46.84" /LENGTH=145 /DNA_ID=CAMNT_0027105483 /DNA_START=151 /DNA_END=585 /DNA_ORIENTATION=+
MSSNDQPPIEQNSANVSKIIEPAVTSDIAPGAVPSSSDVEDISVEKVIDNDLNPSNLSVEKSVAPHGPTEEKWDNIPLDTSGKTKAEVMQAPRTVSTEQIDVSVPDHDPKTRPCSCCIIYDAEDDSPRTCVCYDRDVGCVYFYSW